MNIKTYAPLESLIVYDLAQSSRIYEDTYILVSLSLGFCKWFRCDFSNLALASFTCNSHDRIFNVFQRKQAVKSN